MQSLETQRARREWRVVRNERGQDSRLQPRLNFSGRIKFCRGK